MADLELSPVAVRVKEFIDYLQVSNSQFADQAGIPRPTLSQLLHGRNKSINDLLLQKLHDAFPQLNLMWLLFGKGLMIDPVNSDIAKAQQSTDSTVNYDEKTRESAVNDSLFTYLVSPGDELPSSVNQGEKVVKVRPAERTTSEASDNGAPRRVKSIIVYYTDNSFQTFYPE